MPSRRNGVDLLVSKNIEKRDQEGARIPIVSPTSEREEIGGRSGIGLSQKNLMHAVLVFDVVLRWCSPVKHSGLIR